MSLLAPEGRSDVGAVVIQALICGLLVKRAEFLDVRTHFHEIEDFKKLILNRSEEHPSEHQKTINRE